MPESDIIMFDGVCNLCNGFVKFIISRDKQNRYRFVYLQSPVAAELLRKYGISEKLKTIILIENGKVYDRSTAALRIARHLDRGWSWMYGFIIIPKFIRDGFYRLIAKYRYRWFGKKTHCMIPTPEIKSKFLEYDTQKENAGVGSQ